MSQPDLLIPAPVIYNKDRAELERILYSLTPPPYFRVVLSVERASEKLLLQVLRVDRPMVLTFCGMTLWRGKPDWEDNKALQRSITARSYAGLLTQLHDNPEFLEFEIVIEGGTRYREPVPLTT